MALAVSMVSGRISFCQSRNQRSDDWEPGSDLNSASTSGQFLPSRRQSNKYRVRISSLEARLRLATGTNVQVPAIPEVSESRWPSFDPITTSGGRGERTQRSTSKSGLVLR